MLRNKRLNSKWVGKIKHKNEIITEGWHSFDRSFEIGDKLLKRKNRRCIKGFTRIIKEGFQRIERVWKIKNG